MSPIVETTTAISTVKLCWYATAIAVFEYLNIKDTQICILAILMIIDFIAWIWKQFRINPRDITSNKAWLWAFKKISTLMIVLSFALMFKGIEIDWTFYINWVLAVFIMAETYSIIQNIHTIRTGELHTEYDVISKIIKVIWDFVWDLIDKKLNDITKK
jgi:phage-related holin